MIILVRNEYEGLSQCTMYLVFGVVRQSILGQK